MVTLTTDPRNANKGTVRGRGLLEKSLRNYGAGRSVLADKHGTLIAGNKTAEVALELGLPVRFIETDGRELLVVQRTDLDLSTDKAAVELGIADNRVGQVSLEWDTATLAEMLGEGVDLAAYWHDDELAALLGTVTPPATDPGAQVDRAEELRDKWQTARGDLWLIGTHRLLCGDATSAEDVARLMDGATADMLFADPPFGIAYTGHGASKDGRANKFAHIEGDGMPASEWLPLCLPCRDGAIYLKTTWSVLPAWESALGHQAELRSHIVWDKCSHVAGDVLGGYATQSEIVLFASVGRHKVNHFDTDVWSIPRATTGSPDDRTGHPFESPVGLSERAILNSTTSGDIVLDPFVGSGTTIVAAEQTGRVCYGMEIEPKYAAVALERLAGMGLEPRRA